MKLLKVFWHLFAVIGIFLTASAVWFSRQGIATRTPPTAIEATVARAARKAIIPASARTRQNPEVATETTLRAGLEHWSDHCATCHGNDGSGLTEIGQGLYPRAPDMRQAATQTLTDGELFYIIENGVKLTGMPAWGNRTREGEAASWHLVQFIRHLPKLSDAELVEMEDLNPRGVAEWRALEEERRFLSGQAPKPPAAPAAPHKHKGASQ
jgi:mono/diheme cytochrome c family protein